MTGLPLSPEYVVPDGHFDEVRSVGGALRQPWADFAAATDLQAEYLSEAQKRVDRQIDENGVTYNVYATADAQERPWSLDVLPLIVQAQEWERLGRGLRQGIVGGLTRIIRNHPKDRFGTKVPISGSFDDPAPAVLETVFNVFRNAFVKAFEGRLSNDDIDLEEL